MTMKVTDLIKAEKQWLILVEEDVYETRAGIDTLLKANGYRVAFASVIFFFALGTIFVSRIRSVR